MSTESIELMLDRALPGSPETVFRSLTEPDLFARWMGPEGSEVTVKEMDVTVGGAFTFEVRIPQGPSFTLRGIYREIAEPHRLVHTWAMDGDDEETTVTFDLSPEGSGTRLRLTHAGFVDRSELEQNDAGWRHQLDRLEALVSSLA